MKLLLWIRWIQDNGNGYSKWHVVAPRFGFATAPPLTLCGKSIPQFQSFARYDFAVNKTIPNESLCKRCKEGRNE
jgi:hypothetical protein